MNKVIKKILCVIAFAYGLQLLICAFCIYSVKEEYRIDGANIQISYGEPLAISFVPALGLIHTISSATFNKIDSDKLLSIAYGNFTYKRKLQEIHVNWENVSTKLDNEKILFIEKVNDGEHVVLIFPQDAFFIEY